MDPRSISNGTVLPKPKKNILQLEDKSLEIIRRMFIYCWVFTLPLSLYYTYLNIGPEIAEQEGASSAFLIFDLGWALTIIHILMFIFALSGFLKAKDKHEEITALAILGGIAFSALFIYILFLGYPWYWLLYWQIIISCAIQVILMMLAYAFLQNGVPQESRLMVDEKKRTLFTSIIAVFIIAMLVISVFGIIESNQRQPHGCFLHIQATLENITAQGAIVNFTSVSVWTSDESANVHDFLELSNLKFGLKDLNDSYILTYNETLSSMIGGLQGAQFYDIDNSGTLSAGDKLFVPEDLRNTSYHGEIIAIDGGYGFSTPLSP